MNSSGDKKQNLMRENLDMAMIRKCWERNWMSSDSTKQPHKDYVPIKNKQDATKYQI